MDSGDPLAGRVVAGRYRLGPLLGRGGMAEVRQATDELLQRPVAIKFLDPGLAARPELRRRFEDEARSAARLNHPAVVQVFDTGEWEGRPYLVMEMLSGRTLATEMAAGPLPVARVRAVARDTLAALAAAHRAGVIHRDIKPGNLLSTADGSVKVTDFGIAKADPSMEAVHGAATSTGMVLGTPAYLAPERLAGQPATPASDVWSVGVVCWEALAGRRAFPEGTPMSVGLAVMTTDLPPVRSVRPDADPWLARAVDGALHRDPADRWASAATMREVLLGGHAGDDTLAEGMAALPAEPAPVGAAAAPPVERRPRSAFALGMVAAIRVAAIALVAVALWRNGASSSGGTPAATVVSTSTTSTTSPPPTTTAPAVPAPTAPPTTVPRTTAPPSTTTEAPTTTAPTTPTTVVPTTTTVTLKL